MDPELIKILLGGGGGAGLVITVMSFYRDKKRDRVIDEDTALGRLRDDYYRRDEEAKKAWRLVNWYRNHYVLARDLLSAEQKQDFPPTHPHDIEN